MKEKVQSFGRFLSGMVMPNIGAFIAWGLITALFIATGWLPNEQLSTAVRWLAVREAQLWAQSLSSALSAALPIIPC